MVDNDNKKVKVLKNGPYQVSGSIPLDYKRFVPNEKPVKASLRYEEVQKYDPDEPYFLCRCGKSGSKPFCDGSHTKGFDGTETASFKTYEEMATFTSGKYIDLLDAKELCAAARFCDTKSGTWNLVENGNAPETAEIVKQHCRDCPAGRITAVTKDGKVLEPELPKEISVLKDTAYNIDGPLWVKGGIEVESESGKLYPVRNRVTLCRCGKSKNKPFCDAAHMRK